MVIYSIRSKITIITICTKFIIERLLYLWIISALPLQSTPIFNNSLLKNVDIYFGEETEHIH